MSIACSSSFGYGNPVVGTSTYNAPVTPANFLLAVPPGGVQPTFNFNQQPLFGQIPGQNPAAGNFNSMLGQLLQMMGQLFQMMRNLFGQQSPLTLPANSPASNNANTRLGNSSPTKPTVAVIDDFQSDPDGFNHGNSVAGVIQGDLDASQIQLFSERPSRRPIPEGGTVSDVMSFLAEDHVVGLLDKANMNMEQILNDPNSEIRTINMSLGMSKAKAYQATFEIMKNMPDDTKKEFERELGIDHLPKTDPRRYKAVIKMVDNALDNSPAIQNAMNRYNQNLDRANNAGIAVVVSAGNQQDFIDFLAEEFGADALPADVGVSYLARNPYVITVGAIDDKNNANANDDTVAGFSNKSTGAYKPLLALDGVDVNGNDQLDGTSFSAPQITAMIERLRQVNPNLTPAEVKDILIASASHSVAGMAVPDTDKALALATQNATRAA